MEMNKKLLACLAILAVLGGCGGDDGDGEGGQCEPCRGGNSRCDAGLTCSTFIGGGTRTELCASPSTTECTAPR